MAAYYDEKTKTWYIKFRYTDWQGRAKTTTRRGFKTKREAKAAELAIKNEDTAQQSMTVGDLCNLFLENAAARNKKTTCATYGHIIRTRIVQVVGDVQLSRLTPNIIRQWQNKLNDLAPTTVRSVNRMFSLVLNFGVKYYGLTSNPFKVTGSTGKNEIRMDFWQLDEYTKAEACLPPHMRMIIRMLFYSGMRIGELQALGESDFDFENNTISISKTFVQRRNYITTPKTPSSNRVIKMPVKIMEEVKALIAAHGKHIPPRLFPLTSDAIRVAMTKAAEAAGVKRITPHGLRHSHVSFLVNQKVSINAIAFRLGHSSPAVTLKIYSHLYKEEDDEVAELLNKI